MIVDIKAKEISDDYLGLNLSKNLKNRVVSAAYENHLSTSEFVRTILYQVLDEIEDGE